MSSNLSFEALNSIKFSDSIAKISFHYNPVAETSKNPHCSENDRYIYIIQQVKQNVNLDLSHDLDYLARDYPFLMK